MEYFASGEKVGGLDVFDEVASGNSSCYISADYYFTGKHPGLAYWTSVPFGMTSPEWCAWVKFGGGQALWDEVSGEFGLKAVTCGSTGTQAGGWLRNCRSSRSCVSCTSCSSREKSADMCFKLA